MNLRKQRDATYKNIVTNRETVRQIGFLEALEKLNLISEEDMNKVKNGKVAISYMYRKNSDFLNYTQLG